MTNALLILAGIGLLYFGGDLLVRHASRLAQAWGISPLVIGLTVVAFGTSAPELAASLTAALQGSAEIALGNIVGSNSANIALILGLSALIYPLSTSANFLKREMPIMIGTAALLLLLMLDGSLGRFEGVLFLALLGGFLWILFRGGEQEEVEEQFTKEYSAPDDVTSAMWKSVGGAILGLALLVAGAQLLVIGATSIARALGIPELIIGLTLVAVGTSLPELATSIIAAVKRESDIAIGNVVGSNIFNILGILGVTALVRPIEVPYGLVALDLWVMLAISALLLPLLTTGFKLGRREGTVFLLVYVAYVVVLYLR